MIRGLNIQRSTVEAYKSVIIVLLCSLLAVSPVAGQRKFNVLDWNAGQNLNIFLVQKVHEQYAQRDLLIKKALQSKKASISYRDELRKKYKQLLGNRPATGNFNTQIVGTIQEQGYRVEKIIFESFVGNHITANLYIPEGKGPFPAALLFCGHEAIAKATESYQKTAISFAQNGIVVLMIDPISQGERYQLTDAAGKPVTRGGTAEHILLNTGSNMVGTSIVAYELWDNVRSLDYLISRPEVDKDRIGCLGNSGGGTQTSYMIAFDDRIKIAAPCSYVLNSEYLHDVKGPPDGCVPIVGEATQLLEDADYFIMFAPKPLLILAGRYDFINYGRVTEVYRETASIYKAMGSPERISLFTGDDGHGITRPKREAAVTWFRKWFYNDSTPVKEKEITVRTPAELNCTMNGQVNADYKNEQTIDAYNRILSDQLQGNRSALARGPKETYLQKIKEVAGIHLNTAKVEAEWVGKIVEGSDTLVKVILRRAGEIPMPCLIIYPSRPVSKGKLMVWIPEQGKNKMADSANFVRSCLQKGDALLLADLRGLGENTERTVNNDSEFYNPNYRNSNIACSLGKPLTGQRTQDVLTLLDFIGGDVKLKNLDIEVLASGVAATAVLHAAVFDKRIKKIDVFKSISSYQSLLKTPLILDQYPYVIPGVLEHYDLPDLIELIGKEKVKYN